MIRWLKEHGLYAVGIAALCFIAGSGHRNGLTEGRAECIDVVRELAQAIGSAAEGVP